MAWLTRSGLAGGSKVTPGLSAVGPPPLTSKSQVPANLSTTLVPPYSRYRSAPRTFTQKSREAAGSETTRMWVTATSAPSGPDSALLTCRLLRSADAPPDNRWHHRGSPRLCRAQTRAHTESSVRLALVRPLRLGC